MRRTKKTQIGHPKNLQVVKDQSAEMSRGELSLHRQPTYYAYQSELTYIGLYVHIPSEIKMPRIRLKIFQFKFNYTDFNLSEGFFSTDIIPKCMKWYQIGVHGLKIGQIFAKFQCVSFLIRKKRKMIIW